MLTLEQRKAIYRKAADVINERNLQKFRVETKDYFCKYETELIDLTNKIANWQTYLTDKQLKILQLYLSYRNTSAVDNLLGITNGTTYRTLFGSIKNNQQIGGVFKKLRNVYNTLQIINDRRK
jgi:hypothetical protein